MDALRAADKADAGHAKPFEVHRVLHSGDEIGMICKPEIIVGAEVDRLAFADGDLAPLGRGDEPFTFHNTVSVNLADSVGGVVDRLLYHDRAPLGRVLP